MANMVDTNNFRNPYFYFYFLVVRDICVILPFSSFEAVVLKVLNVDPPISRQMVVVWFGRMYLISEEGLTSSVLHVEQFWFWRDQVY